ncbi:uncharacterized protein [Nicotiana tomentosiformis]|uniref:uncharacterized protein n=1 Tax=Nicotiana tomentosiformis TaxID=4098 RepID=UPI00388CE480
MAPFEALYGRRCGSPIGWFEPGEAQLYVTDLVKDALEKVKLIQERIRTTQSRQKIYVDQKARDVSFTVDEKVLLKFLPMKGITRFGNKGKLSPRFIGPFEVLRRVGEVAYELALPPSLSGVHLDRQLRSKRISVVKVQWRGQPVDEATRESEKDMRIRYPHLFSTSGSEAGVYDY